MSKIRIDWLTDSSDCETCGSSYAEGARVFIDDELALDLSPFAHCFDGVNYDETDVFTKILEVLGHEVEFQI